MHTSQRSSATEYVQCILTSLVGSEVGGEVVDVDENTGVGGAVCTWELDGRRRSGSGTGDVKLEAFGVELRSPNAACDMQS